MYNAKRTTSDPVWGGPEYVYGKIYHMYNFLILLCAVIVMAERTTPLFWRKIILMQELTFAYNTNECSCIGGGG